MKEILRQIASFCMALMVLFSTLSFTVDMHYCGDLLVDYSFFEAAEGCAMEANQSQMDHDNSFMEMSMDCCTDLEIVMEGQDDLKISIDQLTFEQQIFVTAFFYSYINLFKGVDKDTNSFNEYSPPPLIRDIQILDQTFLI
ncbi:hypothetical protein [uncultured Eudoraea sp.]|uniref:HYC_CC_PP family protein n=1 Tax=uncultured Eudoraea sp. TaxID=1035614 RepID=UPI00262B17E6|nr:hypothetical protein [uncultured Eudoraea sp.]